MTTSHSHPSGLTANERQELATRKGYANYGEYRKALGRKTTSRVLSGLLALALSGLTIVKTHALDHLVNLNKVPDKIEQGGATPTSDAAIGN